MAVMKPRVIAEMTAREKKQFMEDEWPLTDGWLGFVEKTSHEQPAPPTPPPPCGGGKRTIGPLDFPSTEQVVHPPQLGA